MYIYIYASVLRGQTSTFRVSFAAGQAAQVAPEPLGRGFLADHHADVHDGSHDLVAAALRVGLLARALDDIECLCTTHVIDFCVCVVLVTLLLC